MIALVAGGTGFIGRHLVRDLVRRGARVRVLARRDRPVEPFEGPVEIVRGDILDVPSLEACARGADGSDASAAAARRPPSIIARAKR